jgi:hypothetical protein
MQNQDVTTENNLTKQTEAMIETMCPYAAEMSRLKKRED